MRMLPFKVLEGNFMFAYVARQAILDRNKNLYSYELLFRDGVKNCFPDIAPDEATSKILTDSHLNLGLEELTDGKLAFINFHEDTLLNKFPTSLEPDKVVIEIVETVKLSPQLVKACKEIKNLGYKIALDDHDFDPGWDVLLPYIDIIKIDIVECDYQSIVDNIDKFKRAGIKLVAEKIETHEEFERYKALDFDYFQGFFFARPEVLKRKQIPTSKMFVIELISASATANFDFNKINNIIQRDVSLSYKLLRFINNPMFNKGLQISSLKHALNYMGEVEVKKFIALLALANLGSEKSGELIHASLVRAKFCDMLGQIENLGTNPPIGFLVGLFSLLDALLDQEMKDIVEILPIGDGIKTALCGGENHLTEYLNLICAFEVGHWKNIRRIGVSLNIDSSKIQGCYNEAIKWGSAMQQTAKI
jgi:EAL and modified HD-GYP domain-containing signal transduction protein